MMYRLVHDLNRPEIAVVLVNPAVLNRPGAMVSTGNAASAASQILPLPEGLPAIVTMWNVVESEWWKEEDGTKRMIMAECLIPDDIPPADLQTIYISSPERMKDVEAAIADARRIPVVAEPGMFFQPTTRISLTPRLSIIDGDMFFSRMSTITISVNTVGVMGKGLASRAKYQFPDLYVIYQDLCKQKTLQIGRPYLYKREQSMDVELADQPGDLVSANAEKWFLLFPTKRHWKEGSNLPDIEAGLNWLLENYRELGIRSLAVPALGCGLGGLEWRDVGPLMCRYLVQMEMQVAIYLPREVRISRELLTPSFLLST